MWLVRRFATNQLVENQSNPGCVRAHPVSFVRSLRVTLTMMAAAQVVCAGLAMLQIPSPVLWAITGDTSPIVHAENVQSAPVDAAEEGLSTGINMVADQPSQDLLPSRPAGTARRVWITTGEEAQPVAHSPVERFPISIRPRPTHPAHRVHPAARAQQGDGLGRRVPLLLDSYPSGIGATNMATESQFGVSHGVSVGQLCPRASITTSTSGDYGHPIYLITEMIGAEIFQLKMSISQERVRKRGLGVAG